MTAIRLDLDCDDLVYRKWGDVQRAKAGDWLVENAGDVYTVSNDTFASTYEQTGPGTFVKTGLVWAEEAEADGSVETQEGRTHYVAGDFIVSNDEAGDDRYAISARRFHALYERAGET